MAVAAPGNPGQFVVTANFDLAGKRVWVAGHRGMVGRALMRRLEAEPIAELLVADRSELDLTDPAATQAWVERVRPDLAFIAAAKVGGIQANDSFPVDFLDINLMIAANTIRAAHAADVSKLVFLGSSCIYPKHAPQPLSEDALLTGPLEPTNQWYAIAKIAGIKLCQAYRRQYGCDFVSAMPTNLYGPFDNFDLQSSHVIPALIAKAHDAKARGQQDLEIWGSGTPRREFLHVDDCADALVFIARHYSGDEHINVGSGEDIAISELARLIMRIVGLYGEVKADPGRPDGTPRKLLSIGRLKDLGWTPKIDLETGLRQMINWYSTKRPDEA